MATKLRPFLSKLLKSSINSSAQYRHNSTVVHASSLFYNTYGEPAEVLIKKNEDIEITNMGAHDVLVKMIAAPVNPADINTIQGKYAVKPSLPSIPGNEGVAEVLAVGYDVTDFNVGDRVIPLKNALGTWRTHALLPDNVLYRVPKKIDVAAASMLTVNPCTAYRMLKDFVTLEEGNTVIQNGGNSSVGQNVIQFCKEWGINTVNIVRDRPDIDALKEYLTSLGATVVCTEEELRKTSMFKDGELEKPRLALNCVGGKSATELIRTLQEGGTMVTYGGMSRQPVVVSTSSLIFKDVNIVGFWMTAWSNEYEGTPERSEMLEDIVKMMADNKLIVPVHAMVPFEKYNEAVDNTLSPSGKIGKKYILDFLNKE